MVTVDISALAGQQVSDVTNTLTSLGLQPQVSYVPQGDHMPDPGTVVDVQPNGSVPAGSVVTVVAVQSQANGNGNGNGSGGGN